MNNCQIKNKIEKLINRLYSEVIVNISHGHSSLRIRLSDTVFNLHSNIIRANITVSNSKRLTFQNEALTNAYELDLLLGIIVNQGFLEKKKFMSLIAGLNEIISMIRVWIQNETNKN